MSSPTPNPVGRAPWPAQLSGASHGGQGEIPRDDGVTVRPMRLKILYTLDDQNKTNCLARWPHVLPIQTVNLDETTTIGVVELQTCIQAVVECSPELVPRMDKDYTVYAYDYSEYDNPLVGQGMLSRALAAASPTPGAPANQSRQLITGRVCNNIMALFNNGVKETLEVKLRLVPVSKAVQGDYFHAMERYRSMSTAGMPGVDLVEWAKFLQSSQDVAPMPTHGAKPSSRDGRSMEVINQLLSPSPSLVPQHQPAQPSKMVNEDILSQSKTPRCQKATKPKTSIKRPKAKRQLKSAGAIGGNTSGYDEGTDADDASLPKKRAKTMQTDWNSKQSLGSAPESLRVAASTAGSLRRFRPIATTPGVNESHLQEIPRVPTPIPMFPNQKRSSNPVPVHSPRQSLTPLVDSPPNDPSVSTLEPTGHLQYIPYPLMGSAKAKDDQIRESIESPKRSSEFNGSVAGTPQNIRSSPPLMRGTNMMRSSPPCPSSPELPPMPPIDSGFMSGSIDDLFECEGESLRPPNEEDIDNLPQYDQRPNIYNQGNAPNEERQVASVTQVCPESSRSLPTKSPISASIESKGSNNSKPTLSKVRNAVYPKSRAPSIISDEGQKLPPPKRNRRAKPISTATTPSRHDQGQQQAQRVAQSLPCDQVPMLANVDVNPLPCLEQPQINQPSAAQFHILTQAEVLETPKALAPLLARPSSRVLIRTASVGSLTLPTADASDPAVPPPILKRSATYTELAAIASEEPIDAIPEPQYSRSSQAKKEAIQSKLQDALKKGQMPPYCHNCGAIETPTWRKAWSQELQGAPAYYEYSDDPGKVTMVVIIGRDALGTPLTHLIVKKFLLPDEDTSDYKEYFLCNPCGIWMSKYKSNRPEEKWDKPPPRPPATRKRPTQRQPKTSKPPKSRRSGLPQPTSEANFPQSEPTLPPCDTYSQEDVAQTEGASPPEVTDGGHAGHAGQQDFLQKSQTVHGQEQQTSEPPSKRLHPITSDAASVALRRAIQSSPARWGSQQSPIEIEEEQSIDSARRLLFPSPRKDGSPMVLGELTANAVHVRHAFPSKQAILDAPNKENCAPQHEPSEDIDAELLRLFEEELASPSTPVQNTPLPNPFKTPTRPTPSHRPITRSVTRSANTPNAGHMSPNATPSKTPSSLATRRSTRHHNGFESPFTASLNQLMSDVNNKSPSRNCGHLGLDFGSLPDLPTFDSNSDVDLNFQVSGYDTNNFFSTDIPMPSSPPKLFRLYEDPENVLNDMNWNDFAYYDENTTEGVQEQVEVKPEPDDEADCLATETDQ